MGPESSHESVQLLCAAVDACIDRVGSYPYSVCSACSEHFCPALITIFTCWVYPTNSTTSPQLRVA
jgi:hypothetical protein